MAGRRMIKRKLNNSGAALVTVIIVIAFISIMVTVMLYMSGMNYQMKSTDKETKDSFYEAETAMENIRSALMVEAKNAYQVAMQTVMPEFINMAEADRRKLYNEAFEDALMEQTFHDAEGNPIDLEAYLQAVSGYPSNVTTTSTVPADFSSDDGFLVIENISIAYTKDGYYTQITTDIKIAAPDLDWQLDKAQTSWADGSDVLNALTRDSYTMADSITYKNWKKE